MKQASGQKNKALDPRSEHRNFFMGVLVTMDGNIVSVKTVETEFSLTSPLISNEIISRKESFHANINPFYGICMNSMYLEDDQKSTSSGGSHKENRKRR